jgi:site-specific DNA-cytosine methylase
MSSPEMGGGHGGAKGGQFMNVVEHREMEELEDSSSDDGMLHGNVAFQIESSEG